MENLNFVVIGSILSGMLIYLGVLRMVLGIDKTQDLLKENNKLLRELIDKK
jgi:hypothetical protein